MRASVMLEGTLVKRTETSLGMFRQRWKYLDDIQTVRMNSVTSSVGSLTGNLIRVWAEERRRCTTLGKSP